MRVVVNVMNLCGIPTIMPDGTSVPKHVPNLYKIANVAVHYLFNHGNGNSRNEQPYLRRLEKLGWRFKKKYGNFFVG